jgi:hypothetical protein
VEQQNYPTQRILMIAKVARIKVIGHLNKNDGWFLEQALLAKDRD